MKSSIRLIFSVLLFSIVQQTVAASDADIVDYGSTPGGFCAAIAAAREGASVILLEPTGCSAPGSARPFRRADATSDRRWYSPEPDW